MFVLYVSSELPQSCCPVVQKIIQLLKLVEIDLVLSTKYPCYKNRSDFSCKLRFSSDFYDMRYLSMNFKRWSRGSWERRSMNPSTWWWWGTFDCEQSTNSCFWGVEERIRVLVSGGGGAMKNRSEMIEENILQWILPLIVGKRVRVTWIDMRKVSARCDSLWRQSIRSLVPRIDESDGVDRICHCGQRACVADTQGFWKRFRSILYSDSSSTIGEDHLPITYDSFSRIRIQTRKKEKIGLTRFYFSSLSHPQTMTNEWRENTSEWQCTTCVWPQWKKLFVHEMDHDSPHWHWQRQRQWR